MLKRLNQFLTAAAFCLAGVGAIAGEITGTVQFKDGSPAANVAVSGLCSGDLGGSTDKVYTDKKGRFHLKWTSKTDLAKVYVRGSTVATNVKSGSDVTLTIK